MIDSLTHKETTVKAWSCCYALHKDSPGCLPMKHFCQNVMISMRLEASPPVRVQNIELSVFTKLDISFFPGASCRVRITHDLVNMLHRYFSLENLESSHLEDDNSGTTTALVVKESSQEQQEQQHQQMPLNVSQQQPNTRFFWWGGNKASTSGATGGAVAKNYVSGDGRGAEIPNDNDNASSSLLSLVSAKQQIVSNATNEHEATAMVAATSITEDAKNRGASLQIISHRDSSTKSVRSMDGTADSTRVFAPEGLHRGVTSGLEYAHAREQYKLETGGGAHTPRKASLDETSSGLRSSLPVKTDPVGAVAGTQPSSTITEKGIYLGKFTLNEVKMEITTVGFSLPLVDVNKFGLKISLFDLIDTVTTFKDVVYQLEMHGASCLIFSFNENNISKIRNCFSLRKTITSGENQPQARVVERENLNSSNSTDLVAGRDSFSLSQTIQSSSLASASSQSSKSIRTQVIDQETAARKRASLLGSDVSSHHSTSSIQQAKTASAQAANYAMVPSMEASWSTSSIALNTGTSATASRPHDTKKDGSSAAVKLDKTLEPLAARNARTGWWSK
jgi:hypothetical protein